MLFRSQLGTGHAFIQGLDALSDHQADVLVLYGDTPLLRADTLTALLSDHRARGGAFTVLTGELPDATGYGRIIRGADGAVERILRDAFARGYDAGISIEPHMVAVFHDANSAAQDDALRANYVEYGRRLEALIARVRP